MEKISQKLRFKDDNGNDFPEWEEKKLGEICKIYDGTHQTPNYVEDGIPFYSVEHVTANNFTKSKFISKEVFDKENQKVRLEKGDILMTKIGDIGTAKYIDWDVNASFYVSLALIKQSHKHNNKFVCHYINSESFQLELHKRTIHVAFPKKINLGEIGECSISLPCLEEQTKIANFLSAIDEKIENLEKELDELKAYKKGVMQAIFTNSEDMLTGGGNFRITDFNFLRFKDDNGNDFPKWEEKKLGELFVFNTTNSFSRDNLNYETGSVKNIHYGDIHTKFQTHFDITNEYVPFVNDDISLQKFRVDNYCKEGDLIIADASEDYADIGKAIEIINLNNEKLIAGLHTLHARPNSEKLAIGFSGHLMKSENVRLQIKTQAQGTKVLSITTSRLSQLNIKLPCIEEQTKIADFLSNIDEKINNFGVQIEDTKHYKRGISQRIFV